MGVNVALHSRYASTWVTVMALDGLASTMNLSTRANQQINYVEQTLFRLETTMNDKLPNERQALVYSSKPQVTLW